MNSWQASSDQSTFHCLEIAREVQVALLWALVAYVAFAGAGSICFG